MSAASWTGCSDLSRLAKADTFHAYVIQLDPED